VVAVLPVRDGTLAEAFSIIEHTAEIEAVIVKLRNFFEVAHVIYISSRLGVGPSPDPYIRLTYPAAWVKRYIQMGYGEVDPVMREGFRRAVPFDWSEIEIQTAQEAAFLADAVAHGIGPRGFSIPVVSKRGHRAMFAVTASHSEEKWKSFLQQRRSSLIEVANRLHRRVVAEVLGENRPHLTARELECLRLVALGKGPGEIAVVLGISTHTARDYLKSARYKLDSATLAQAVGKAVNFGLLIL
jgi:LuxR family transcriptional regulator, quorum-sensing system regulator CinR